MGDTADSRRQPVRAGKYPAWSMAGRFDRRSRSMSTERTDDRSGPRLRAKARGGGSLRHSRRAYDALVKQINCVCGKVVKGDDDDELWEKAQAHLRTDHPELVGKVSRKDILAQAEET